MRETRELKEIDRLATEQANKGGRCWRAEPWIAALFTAAGTWIVLGFFGVALGVSLDDQEPARIIFVVLVAGGVYFAIQRQQNNWNVRQFEAFIEIKRAREEARKQEHAAGTSAPDVPKE